VHRQLQPWETDKKTGELLLDKHGKRIPLPEPRPKRAEELSPAEIHFRDVIEAQTEERHKITIGRLALEHEALLAAADRMLAKEAANQE
jgi:hypothetical protein